MRFLGISLMAVLAALTIAACSSSKSTSAESTAAASAEASGAASTDTSGASPEASAAASAAAGDVPSYPGATTAASGSSSNMGQSASGTVMTTDDSFDKVYGWYQKNMPAGSEKSHVTSPVQTAVFMVGDPSSGQTSVTISVSGGKTMITVGKVNKM